MNILESIDDLAAKTIYGISGYEAQAVRMAAENLIVLAHKHPWLDGENSHSKEYLDLIKDRVAEVRLIEIPEEMKEWERYSTK